MVIYIQLDAHTGVMSASGEARMVVVAETARSLDIRGPLVADTGGI